MNKQKVKEIVKFGIRQNIQNKWFVVCNVLLLIFILVMTNANNIRQFLEDNNISLFNDSITIEYIDRESLMGNKLEEEFADQDNVSVLKTAVNDYTADNIPDDVILIEVVSDENEIIKATITSKEGIDTSVYNEIVDVLEETRLEVLAEMISSDESMLEKLNTDVSVERVMLGVNAENSETKETIKYISTMIVYLVSIFIFSKIANEIAQEKVSKSIEYVLTSVTAKEYLLAKVITTISVVLIQAMYLLAYYFTGNLISTIIGIANAGTAVTTSSVLAGLDLDIIKYICIVFVYAVLTIILLTIIQAALSSKTTSMSEAGNSMMFLMVLTVAVYFLTFVLINSYTNMSPWIYVLSCIPLISNYFIPAIIIIGQATTLQIVVSLALLVISIPIAFNICSKIFKNGVLDYKTSKPKRKAKKELSLKEEQEIKLTKYKFRKLAFVIGISCIMLIVLEILVQLLVSLLVLPLFENILDETKQQILLSILTSAISMLLPALFVMMYTKKNKNKPKTKRTGYDNFILLIISIFLIIVIQFGVSTVEEFIGVEYSASEEILEVEGLDDIGTAILYFIEIAIIPAIFEELFFRKALIDLSSEFGKKFSILLSAIIFGAMHLNLSQSIFAFCVGLIFGTVYVKTGSMKYNVLLHALNNGYAALAVIFVNLNMMFPYFVLTWLVFIIAFFGGLQVFRILILTIRTGKRIFSKEKILPKNAKYIFTDFTMIVSIIFVAAAFVATESLMRIL